MAIFLAHWDNKATNQRLVCEDGPGDTDPEAACRAPLLILQDLGSTFGPAKVRHARWTQTPVWADAGQCTVSMDAMPFHGGNFRPVQISEAGRAWLAGRLRQFSEQ